MKIHRDIRQTQIGDFIVLKNTYRGMGKVAWIAIEAADLVEQISSDLEFRHHEIKRGNKKRDWIV